MDYPKLRTPLGCLIIAAFCVAIAIKGEKFPDWARWGCALAALVCGVVGVVTLLDWIANHANDRLREFNAARVYGAMVLAQSLEGLSTFQTEAVMAGERVAMHLIPGDEKSEPILFVQGLTGSIPWDFADEFFKDSQRTDPFLWPVREASNEAYATDLTNLIVARGWAAKAVGPMSAKLVKPLKWVAGRFWVELQEEQSD